jgi:hypothetical protein
MILSEHPVSRLQRELCVNKVHVEFTLSSR